MGLFKCNSLNEGVLRPPGFTFSALRGEVQPQALYPLSTCSPLQAEAASPFGTTKLTSEEKLSQQLVLDPLFSHSCWWCIHTQGDDNALTIFRFNALPLWLLCLVTILALGGQGC